MVEQGRPSNLLLDKRCLETSAPQLRQSLTYLLHLRSCWKPEERTKFLVPTPWMRFLSFASANRECDQHCPFRNVRFESTTEMRLAERLPLDVVSRVLTDIETDGNLGPETVIPLAFEGIPRTRPRSDGSAMTANESRAINFELVLDHGSHAMFSGGNILLGMGAPSWVHHADTRSGPLPWISIPEELTNHGHLHLMHLAPLIERNLTGTGGSDPFPEWFVLFGLVYDAHRICIVAYVPQRHKSDAISCTAYILDDLAFHSFVPGTSTCELALERLRFLLALTALRRHVYRLSRFLSPYDVIGHADRHLHWAPVCLACDQLDSSDYDYESHRCTSLGSTQYGSSEYSTCPSSVPARELTGIPVQECEEYLSSSCTFCSTCSSLSRGASISNSSYSDESSHTISSHMELPRGDEIVPCPNTLTENKRREVVAWARQVIPTEHPVMDTYRMVLILGGPGSQSESGTCR